MEKWLEAIEKENNIDILFACEAGSRAWGTNTPESDYDIRFIYRHNNIRAYLSLAEAKEVIDTDTPYDTHGWDLFKAFRLMKKSNPSIYEWAFSPVVYKDENQFSSRLKEIVQNYFSPFSLFQHYIQLASRNLKEVSRKDSYTDKSQKQLIQAVRAILIAKNIMADNAVKPDWLFKNLLNSGNSEITKIYIDLVEAKRSRILLSHADFHHIQSRLEQEQEELLEKRDSLPAGANAVNELNQWLWELLQI